MGVYKFSAPGTLKTGRTLFTSMLAGNPVFVEGGDYESIQTVTVGAGGQSSVTFTSIPSTYSHLQLRAISRGTTSAANVEMFSTFNSTTSNYWRGHQIFGDGSAATANAESTSTSNYVFFSPAATALSNTFATGVLDILDYSNTNKNKTLRTLTGFDVNGSGGFIILRSGLSMNTAAISQIDLTLSAGNFAQYSSFALYGIK